MLISESGVTATEAPVECLAQKSSIWIMSFLPPVLLVVMLFMVKPRVKTSAEIGGHMPTKQMVPRGRRRGKNLANRPLFVAIVDEDEVGARGGGHLVVVGVHTRNLLAPCESAASAWTPTTKWR